MGEQTLRCVRCGEQFVPEQCHDGWWFTGAEDRRCLRAPDLGPCESLPVPFDTSVDEVRQGSSLHIGRCPRSHPSPGLDLRCTCRSQPLVSPDGCW